MKNELHPWEGGIAEQMKGKEFSFDPQAFADFENLLEAEMLGQEPGQRAPDAAKAIMSAGRTTVSLPMILLAISLACLATWGFWPQETTGTTEPEPTTLAPAISPAPLTNIAPAAAPNISERSGTMVLEVAPGPASNTLGSALPFTDLSANEKRQPTTDLTRTTAEAVPRSPRILKAVKSLTSLPIQPVTPLHLTTISLPTVQKPTPTIRKRDRKTLFPDVIKKN